MMPLDFIQMIRNGANPQQMVMGLLQQQAEKNPRYQMLSDLAKQGKTNDIEAFARNYVNSQGGDFDRDFNAFRKSLGLK